MYYLVINIIKTNNIHCQKYKKITAVKTLSVDYLISQLAYNGQTFTTWENID